MMMRSTLACLSFVAMLCSILPAGPVQAASFRERVRGQVLLQVEDKGEAWYVDPANGSRTFLYHPDNMFAIMRERGLGISNADLAKIPVGLFQMSGQDTDGDHLSDDFEKAYGTDPAHADTDGDGFTDEIEVTSGFNPQGSGNLSLDTTFAKHYDGQIFLQVEARGAAWWVNPTDHRRYFLGRPSDALELVRSLGLGISNADLAQVPIETKPITCFLDISCFLAAIEVRQPVKFQYTLPLGSIFSPRTEDETFIDFQVVFGDEPAPQHQTVEVQIEAGHLIVPTEARGSIEEIGAGAASLSAIIGAYSSFLEEEHFSFHEVYDCYFPHKESLIETLKGITQETTDPEALLDAADTFPIQEEVQCEKIAS